MDPENIMLSKISQSVKSNEYDKLMNKIEIEAQIHGPDRQLREGRQGYWMKDGEGINQRTFMNNQWTWTTIQGMTQGGERVGPGKGENAETKVTA